MSHIYILTNKINDKKYVGQTTDIDTRINQHKKCYGNYYIHRAIKKYGWDSFTVELISVNEDDLNNEERKYIKELNTLAPNGYNLTEGGSSGRRSEITKQNMSKGMTNYLASETPQQKHERYSNISISEKKYYNSLSEDKKEEFWKRMFNITEEEKQERIKKATNTYYSKTSSERLQIQIKRSKSIKEAHANRSKEEKEEIALHISQVKKGKPLTQNHKKKLSEAAKRRWAKY